MAIQPRSPLTLTHPRRSITSRKPSRPKFLTLNGADAKNLTLWRVSIKDDRDDEVPILLNLQPEKTKLRATDDVSDVFDAQPPKKTISIIMQRPGNAALLDI